MKLRHWPSAWMWLSTDLDGLQRRALRRHQVEMDRQEILADDVQLGVRHQVMDVGDAAGDRVLDRDHAEVGLAGLRSPRSASSKVGAGQRLAVRIDLAAGDVRNWRPARPGTRSFSLLMAVPLRAGARSSQRRAAAARAPFPDPPAYRRRDGTVSTSATSMRMPASSARSCSSRSRCSSGEGGSATKRSSAARR